MSKRPAMIGNGFSPTTRSFVWSLCSGVLILTAFYVPYAWWLSFFAVVPFIHSLRIARTWYAVLLSSALFGSMLIGGATVATLWATLPPSVSITNPFLEHSLVLASWLLFFVPLVPTVVAWAFVAHSMEHFSNRNIVWLIALWVVLEWARMFLFNMATYAPGVDNPPFFSASFLGYVLADSTSWLQFAALGGVYLLGAIVIGVNLVAYRILAAHAWRPSRLFTFLVLVLVLISFLPIARIRASMQGDAGAQTSIGFMSISKNGEDIPFSKQVRAAVDALSLERPDLIVLPEGATLYGGNAGDTGVGDATTVLTSWAEDGPDVYARVAEVRTVNGEVLTIVRGKSALAPQGEYVTSLFLWIAKHVGMQDRVRTDHLSSAKWGTGFSIGKEGVEASVLFCSEVLTPFYGRQRVLHDGSTLLVFVLSHNQFRNPYTLRVDTLRFLKVRTVEAGVPSVSSSHDTAAYALDSFGRVTMSLGTDGTSETGVIQITGLSTDALAQSLDNDVY